MWKLVSGKQVDISIVIAEFLYCWLSFDMKKFPWSLSITIVTFLSGLHPVDQHWWTQMLQLLLVILLLLPILQLILLLLPRLQLILLLLPIRQLILLLLPILQLILLLLPLSFSTIFYYRCLSVLYASALLWCFDDYVCTLCMALLLFQYFSMCALLLLMFKGSRDFLFLYGYVGWSSCVVLAILGFLCLFWGLAVCWVWHCWHGGWLFVPCLPVYDNFCLEHQIHFKLGQQ